MILKMLQQFQVVTRKLLHLRLGCAFSSDSSDKSYYDQYSDIFKNYDTVEKKLTSKAVKSSEPSQNETEQVINKDRVKFFNESSQLTHVDAKGEINMVDVGMKPVATRQAVASTSICLGPNTFELVKSNSIAKGDVLTMAKIAGIMAAKKTSSLIPLCHPIALNKIDIDLRLNEDEYSVNITCKARTQGKTGVEMEALTGASVAALTVYDMCKATSREMVIGNTRLLEKTGGVRGDYKYEPDG